MSEEKIGFHIVYKTDEDYKKELREIIQNLTEEQKTEHQFEGQYLYEIGRGHDFVFGFFMSFVTKGGIQATGYLSGRWVINGEEYDLKGGNFIKRPKVEYTPLDFDKVQFPVIKNVNAKTISGDIPSEAPRRFS